MCEFCQFLGVVTFWLICFNLRYLIFMQDGQVKLISLQIGLCSCGIMCEQEFLFLSFESLHVI